MKFALLIASIVDFVVIGITCFAGPGAFGPNWLLLISLIMYVIFVIAAWKSMGIPISSLPKQLLSYSILLGPPLCLIVLVVSESTGLAIPTLIQTLLTVTPIPIPILCIFAIVLGQYKAGHVISPWTFAAICAMTIMQPAMQSFTFLLVFYNISRIELLLAVSLSALLLSTLLLSVMAAIKDRQRAIQIIAVNIASTGMVLFPIIWSVEVLMR
jgi:hypothetical protein